MIFQNLDAALDKVGNQGYYQKRTFTIFCLIISVCALQIMSPTYTYIKPKFLCNGEVYYLPKNQPCFENELTCSEGIELDPSFKYKNIVTQFNLYCDRQFYIQIVQSINFLGSAFGGSIMSFFGDRIGREPTFILSWFIATLGILGIYLSPNIIMLIISTFVMGFGEIGSYILCFVMINEICGNKLRQVYCLSMLGIWSFAEIIGSVLYYFITDWKTIQLYLILLPSVAGLGLCYLIHETPKYYFSKGQNLNVMKSLNRIAVLNGNPQLGEITINDQPSDSNAKYGYLDLFKYSSLRLPSIGFMLISFSIHLIYYGGQYGLDDISEGDMLYIMGAVIGFGEMSTYIGIAMVISKMPRRKWMMISFIISLVACFGFLEQGFKYKKIDCDSCSQKYIMVFLACLVRVGNTIGFAIQGLFANEFYPTPIRSLGTGFLFSVGIFGSFSAPYVLNLGRVMGINPYIILGIFSLSGPLGTLFTKETLNRPLKDKIIDKSESEID